MSLGVCGTFFVYGFPKYGHCSDLLVMLSQFIIYVAPNEVRTVQLVLLLSEDASLHSPKDV